jgi:hypothetical protein
MRPFLVTAGLVARRRSSEGGGGGDISWVAAGTPYSTISSLTEHEITVPAGAQVGDMLLLATWAFGDVTSAVTNTSQSMSLLVANASNVGRIYGVVIAGSVPTTITVTLSAANDFTAQPFLARGVTQSAGTVDTEVFEERTTMSYSSDVAASLVLGVYTTPGSQSRALASATFSGSTYNLTKFEFTSFGTFAGVHAGATGANAFGVTWNETDSGGRWISVALKP